jgi:hypothetical protein
MEDEENQGSMIVGLLLGLFLGCVGVPVAYILQGSRTVTGAIMGMVMQWIGVCSTITCLGVLNNVMT